MVFVSTAPVFTPLGSPPFGLKRAHCHARRNLACAHPPNEASPKRRREVLELTAAVIGSPFLRPGQSVASDDTAPRCFLDLSFNGQAQGRIVIELTDGLVSTGCRRFYDLARPGHREPGCETEPRTVRPACKSMHASPTPCTPVIRMAAS